ncbi:hypothetical protein DPMN_012357 [Dreissena polymorpha]|uniref:Uncharacterized protein n=1 Tax=Dreissena polymorpha TaxID=45954 RepID=A0A9D4N5T9_DREPO|nr:hypothetical protein DPMN_012357 [Dreissena polymorpha]
MNMYENHLMCRSYKLVYNIWSWLVSKLGDQAYVDGDRSVEHRVVEMFHAWTTNLSKERILNEFFGEESVKIVVETVAFGLWVTPHLHIDAASTMIKAWPKTWLIVTNRRRNVVESSKA